MGIIGFAFASLEMFSKNADGIYEKAKEAITKKMASLPPGLKEQYEMQLNRLKTAPGCEFISIPGGMSQPSWSFTSRLGNKISPHRILSFS